MDPILIRQNLQDIHSPHIAKTNLEPSVTVNLSAIQENYRFFQANCSGSVQCSAVVKNNAYGLGLEPVVQALFKAGCRIFWVAYLQEALKIRAIILDPTVQIIVLQDFSNLNQSVFFEYRLIPVLSTPEQCLLWIDQIDKIWDHSSENIRNKIINQPILQIDTGLNRLGLRAIDFEKYPEIFKINSMYLMSHLACADQPGHFMNVSQLEKFKQVKQQFEIKSQKIIQGSLVASDGFFLGSEYHFDLLRIGAGLYGVNPSPYRETQMKAVVTLEASVLQISELNAGDYVGYGATFRSHQVKKIAMISIGYGDGLPCHLKNMGRVWFQDYEARILGRISMDIIVCDVSEVPIEFLYPGYRVSILNQFYTIDDLAHDSGTIGYEILTRLRPRGGMQYCLDEIV